LLHKNPRFNHRGFFIAFHLGAKTITRARFACNDVPWVKLVVRASNAAAAGDQHPAKIP